jgi:hypothetical protein
MFNMAYVNKWRVSCFQKELVKAATIDLRVLCVGRGRQSIHALLRVTFITVTNPATWNLLIEVDREISR